ncbi:MAG: hypothetical protein [Circular genetic element sp.]|nr:MAG: hypothetical protein [Circular genetic element sp.]
MDSHSIDECRSCCCETCKALRWHRKLNAQSVRRDLRSLRGLSTNNPNVSGSNPMDPMADLEQNLKLSDLEKRLSAVELKLDQIQKLVQVVVTIAGAALGIDIIPMMA